jgi:phosphatidate phosphatase PAH1
MYRLDESRALPTLTAEVVCAIWHTVQVTRFALAILTVAGSLVPPAAADSAHPRKTRASPAPADTRCATPPAVTAKGWRHKRSRWTTKLGAHNHRGIDVIANEQDAVQVVAGKLAYGKADKDIQDEDAEVFACAGAGGTGTWRSLGVARTDSDGRFTIELRDKARLAVGMRDLYVAAHGDGSGSYFIGYVAPRGANVVVTDVDGTISWSENSIVKQAVKRSTDVKPRPNAPAALSQLSYPIVYVTARGDVFINLTRRWLESHGFPRGLLRLSQGAFAKPGASAIAYKTETLKALGIPIAAGIGNRKSDITAYTRIGLTGKQILIHLPEYEEEVRADLAAGNAIGFADYLLLPKLLP